MPGQVYYFRLLRRKYPAVTTHRTSTETKITVTLPDMPAFRAVITMDDETAVIVISISF